MTLLNDNIKMMPCSDFRIFLKKMINDKIEKEWTENFVENLNFVMVSRNTIKRRSAKTLVVPLFLFFGLSLFFKSKFWFFHNT